MRKAIAFSPGHITGFFKVCDVPVNPLYKGSLGAGFSITHGVKTLVSLKKSSKTHIRVVINGREVKSAPVSYNVVRLFLSQTEICDNYEILIKHTINVPVGGGFGSSGAGALSLALALNETFNAGMPKIKAAQIAHVAEIICKTGLGTVIAETFGGVEVRVKPGAPGIGEVRHIHVNDEYVAVCLHFKPLPTRRILSNENIRKRINEIGGELIDKLVKEPTVDKFMQLSRRFAENLGVITERVRSILKETDAAGVICSTPMFGESIFALTRRDFVKDLLKIFRNHALREKGSIIVGGVDFRGARLLDEES